MKKRIVVVVLCVLLVIAVALSAQKPAHNVSAERHPNLAASQRLIGEAFQKLIDAQQANEWDMNGHAAKAKQLLQQAADEIKLAAQAANEHSGK